MSTEKDDDGAAIVRYVNSSDLPVYSVLLCCHMPPPTEMVTVRYPVLGPLSGRRTLRKASRMLREHLDAEKFMEWHDDGRVLVAISFRDAAGAWWFRTAEGELREAEYQAEAEAKAADTRTHEDKCSTSDDTSAGHTGQDGTE